MVFQAQLARRVEAVPLTRDYVSQRNHLLAERRRPNS